MSHQSDREEFVRLIEREAPTVPDRRGLCDLILRDAQTVQRYAVLACNRELTPNEEKREAQACARLERRVASLGEGWSVRTSGDPRGYCVKLTTPRKSHNTWGGIESGWGVPARG